MQILTRKTGLPREGKNGLRFIAVFRPGEAYPDAMNVPGL